jgi:threonine/homoserine/homoserine lactone efflux protein
LRHERTAVLGLIAQGMGFGFTAGTAPGPLLNYIITTTLGKGWRAGIVAIFAPLVSDVPIILVMTLLLDTLPDSTVNAIQIAGGAFVLWLAWSAWRALRSGAALVLAEDVAPVARRRTLLQSAGINLLSPGPYIYWGSVTGPILVAALDDSVWHGLAFLLAFYGAFLVILAGLVFIFDRLRRLDPRITHSVLLLSIVIMAILGMVLISGGLRG